mmetsp:Transcript_71226/g.82850  ORF Transcript_71226/g.82850 Transcript_71226/m.82850 type:complete len:190 (+) Transcript_71226:38-607(+)
MSENNDGISLVDSSEWTENKKKTSKKTKNQPTPKWKLFGYGFIGILWIIFMRYAANHGFGQTALILSMMILIFLNLGKRKEGSLSAYSIFNKGTQRLLGTFAHDAIDRQFGGRVNEEEYEETKKESQKPSLRETKFNEMSKMSNKACYCGSGKKYKKCCYWRELRAREEKYKPKPVNNAQQDMSDSESD